MKLSKKSKMKIAPSILDANLNQLQQELDSLGTSNRIHLDIMDGHFVQKKIFENPELFKNILFPTETEAHLMVNDPETYFENFLNLGVSGITFHLENTGAEKAIELLRYLRSRFVRAGISIDMPTDDATIPDEILKLADQILIMSVKAGKGGQSFSQEALEKVSRLRKRGFRGEIEMDGGVNLDNAQMIKDAGVDTVVVGSFLMKNNDDDRKKIIQEFQKI